MRRWTAACLLAAVAACGAAEATAHARTLGDWTAHQRARAGQMEGMMSGMGGMGGGMDGGSTPFTCPVP
jgi:hypothetical protein